MRHIRRTFLTTTSDDVLQIYQCAGFLCCSATTLHHSAIALDRHLAVMHPVAYRNLEQRAYVGYALSIVWLASLLTTAPLVFVDMQTYWKLGESYQCDTTSVSVPGLHALTAEYVLIYLLLKSNKTHY